MGQKSGWMLFTQGTFGDIETTQKLEKEAWEYTSREFIHEYRFDTVFNADRFSSILQYLQSEYLQAGDEAQQA